jgi:hypothetical protein
MERLGPRGLGSGEVTVADAERCTGVGSLDSMALSPLPRLKLIQYHSSLTSILNDRPLRKIQ